jgi:hypothetical protein
MPFRSLAFSMARMRSRQRATSASGMAGPHWVVRDEC